MERVQFSYCAQRKKNINLVLRVTKHNRINNQETQKLAGWGLA